MKFKKQKSFIYSAFLESTLAQKRDIKNCNIFDDSILGICADLKISKTIRGLLLSRSSTMLMEEYGTPMTKFELIVGMAAFQNYSWNYFIVYRSSNLLRSIEHSEKAIDRANERVNRIINNNSSKKYTVWQRAKSLFNVIERGGTCYMYANLNFTPDEHHLKRHNDLVILINKAFLSLLNECENDYAINEVCS